ncbi:MAG: biotin--[acetyl-CoA-carboxylase] ligase [Aeromicrobium sp.]|uniref:biotin--[acetyl-CoA-carboxylase] ligase n=1 Tax=Aeromicrobium sp. TaxID=1871063 RepID=UPI0039E69FDA
MIDEKHTGDDFDPASLAGGNWIWGDIVVTDTTASTNADAAAAARAGAAEGTVFTTRHQSAGRGRLGRSFELPPGTGIAVSVVLRPHMPLAAWSWLPLLTGLAVLDTVRDLGVDARLKWPNDVLAGGRKISGILLEAVDGTAAVIGIGLNVSVTADDLPVPTATSLLLEGAASTDRTDVLRRLLDHLDSWYRRWIDGADVRTAYRADCATVGQQVRVERPEGLLTGLAEDIDAAGRLVVDGQPLSAGDVTHVRPQR